MRVVVPFDAARPKTRLSPLLDPDECLAFARAMLAEVLATVRDAGGLPTVVATADVTCEAPVTVDDRPLSAAVDARLPRTAADDPVAVVMADLPLATPAALERLFDSDAAVTLAPGRGAGTNALRVDHPDFAVDYHGVSLSDHRAIAREIDATYEELDSLCLATDVDEPADLLEVLLHGSGGAADWLRDAGFEVVVEDGRPTIARE